jgi:hypothetical protein
VTDIFQEVEEEVRRERLEQLWRRYGSYIIAGAAFVVVATAAVTGWRAYSDRIQAERAREFIAAATLLETSPREAAQAFEVLAGKSGTYGVLARFRQAEAQLRRGDVKQAAAIYDDIAADSRARTRLRDLAALKSAYLNADTISLADLRARLAPVMRSDGAWRHLARELLAFAALKAGERKTAIEDFRALAEDPTAPGGVRSRAVTMLASLGEPTPADGASPAPPPQP